MMRYAKSHTHIDLARRSSILLVGRRSCSQVVDLDAHGHWINSISVDGLENWFLACNETTKISEPGLLVCKSILWVEGESIGKIMIIGHRMKDCSSWKQWSLDTGWNCSSWCQEVLGYLPRTRLRARGMSQGFFWQLCSRDEQPNHPYHKNSSSNWEIEEEEEEIKAKACALQDLFFAP
jgi:hypothetical protein